MSLFRRRPHEPGIRPGGLVVTLKSKPPPPPPARSWAPPLPTSRTPVDEPEAGPAGPSGISPAPTLDDADRQLVQLLDRHPDVFHRFLQRETERHPDWIRQILGTQP